MQMARFYDRNLSAVIRYSGARKNENDEIVEDTIANELAAKMSGRESVSVGTVFDTSAGALADTHGVKRIFHVASSRGFREGATGPRGRSSTPASPGVSGAWTPAEAPARLEVDRLSDDGHGCRRRGCAPAGYDSDRVGAALSTAAPRFSHRGGDLHGLEPARSRGLHRCRPSSRGSTPRPAGVEPDRSARRHQPLNSSNQCWTTMI